MWEEIYRSIALRVVIRKITKRFSGRTEGRVIRERRFEMGYG
jgi:hypothetical protein